MSPKILVPGRSHNRGTTEVAFSDPGPSADAIFDIQGNAILLDPPSPKYISESNPNSELDTPVLSLPPEVRCQIWEEILGGHKIHLEVEKGCLRGVECIALEPRRCHEAPFTRGCQAQYLDNQKPGQLYPLPLLLTCKLM